MCATTISPLLGFDGAPSHAIRSQVVNVVRFCPLGMTLASAGDDALIMLWRQRANRAAGFGGAVTSAGALSWGAVCALRGHCDDVYDLCWSPHGDSLFSGGVDGSTIVWNIGKGKPAQIVREHEHYVQGVAWDPADQYIVSVSLDRTSRIYSATSAAKLGKVSRTGQDRSSTLGLDNNAVQREFVCHTVLSKRTASFVMPPKIAPRVQEQLAVQPTAGTAKVMIASPQFESVRDSRASHEPAAVAECSLAEGLGVMGGVIEFG